MFGMEPWYLAYLFPFILAQLDGRLRSVAHCVVYLPKRSLPSRRKNVASLFKHKIAKRKRRTIRATRASVEFSRHPPRWQREDKKKSQLPKRASSAPAPDKVNGLDCRLLTFHSITSIPARGGAPIDRPDRAHTEHAMKGDGAETIIHPKPARAAKETGQSTCRLVPFSGPPEATGAAWWDVACV